MLKILNLFLLLVFFLPGYSKILKRPIPDKLVVLTFDDAPESQYTIVAPILKEFGFGATFFVCEIPPNYRDSTKYLNWRQIQALDRMGFEIANHTKSHVGASHLSEAGFEEQLTYIEKKCDSLGIAKTASFAFPGYDWSPAVIEKLAKEHYDFARAGGNKAYDPATDHPLFVPSWAMTDKNKDQITKAFQEAHDGKIVVITIHGVPDLEHPWVNTAPALFREHMQYLADHHYQVISLRDLNKYIHIKKAQKILFPEFRKRMEKK